MELTPARRRTTTLLAGLAALAMVGALSIRTSQAVFTATTANAGNSFETGTVALTNSGAAGGTLSVANMRPGSFLERCITLTYTGTLETTPVSVAVTAPAGSPALADALQVTVREAAMGSTCASTAVGGGTALGSALLASGPSFTGNGGFAKGAPGQTRAYTFRVELPVSADNSVMGQTVSGVDISWNVATPSTTEDLS
ncbi:MAG: hypothetical protein ACLGIR_09050 [Actinomycetes bacterium]